MQNWIPLNDRVMIKRGEDVRTSKGGIYLPENAKEKQSEGEVIAVGKGRIDNNGKNIVIDLKIGDRVVFGKYAGVEAKIDDEIYLVMKEDEVLMKLSKEL